MSAEKPATVTVARILRPHGRRGEVAAEILTEFPERLTRLTHAELYDARTGPNQTPPATNLTRRSVAIRSCWLAQSRGGQAIFHFEGSDSISDAEKLAGMEVRIPFSERMALPAGSYYVTDLVGCEVREKDAALGAVRDVQFTGGPPLLVVDAAGGELLIPLAQEICVNVDVAARRIDVILPEGLQDLNR
ncbi:MAG: ribosome maturation factor RimM [Candidatus Acidiferrales bacterium]